MLAFVGLTVGATTFSKPESWSEGTPAEGVTQLLVDIEPMVINYPKIMQTTSQEIPLYFITRQHAHIVKLLSLKSIIWHKSMICHGLVWQLDLPLRK